MSPRALRAVLGPDPLLRAPQRPGHRAWGARRVIPIPADDRFRMRVDDLETALEQAKAEGRR